MPRAIRRHREASLKAAALVGLWLSFSCALKAQAVISIAPGSTIQTVAGEGAQFFSGDNGPAANAALASPFAAAADSAGNIYVADSLNHRVRIINISGQITTFAGSSTQGFSGDGGPASSASLNTPSSVAVDASGKVYIADSDNNAIRVVSGGTITTFAGSSHGTPGYTGDGGAATGALLSRPLGVAVDGAGNVYIADTNNFVVRKVSGGTITTVAGNGQQGFSGDGGPATSASLDTPTAVALDASGNIYIADSKNERIRMISGGTITTFAGNGAAGFIGVGVPATDAAFDNPLGVAADSLGNVYIADSNNDLVRVVNTSGTINTLAGDLQEGFLGDNGVPTAASLDTPSGVLPFKGGILIADKDNERIRSVESGLISFANQVIGTTSSAETLTISNVGNALLSVTSITPSPSDFVLASGGTCGTTFPKSVGPGSNCTLNLVFTPASVGSRNGTLQFADNASGSPQVLSIVGNGIQDSTAVAVSSSQAASTFGSSVTLTATITPAVSTTAPAPTGTVTFSQAANVLASVPVTSDAASFSTSALLGGTQVITAAYSGDTNYASSAMSFSQVVNRATPTVALTVQPNPPASAPVTLTAKVSSSAGVPTGTVTFTDNNAALGSASLNSSGVATLTQALLPGANALVALYNGDVNFTTASSSPLNEQSNPFSMAVAPMTATISSGRAATFTISVMGSAGFSSAVTLGCANLPTAASCSFSQATVNPNASTATSMLTLSTSMAATPATFSRRRGPAPGLVLISLATALWLMFSRNQRFAQRKSAAAFACILMLVLFASSCSSNSGSGSTTAPGSYSVTVTASGGGTSQNATLNITVTQ